MKTSHWSVWLVWIAAALLVVVVFRNGWEAYQAHQRMRAVRCDEPVFDFGQAFVGDVIEHTFRVTNVSRVPLKIATVHASCGCTTVATKLEGTSIGAGESFEVPVQLTLSGSEEGDFERPVVVRFAGEPRLQVTLKLMGTVEKPWKWSRETVVFYGVPTDEPVSRTLELIGHPKTLPGALPRVVAPTTGMLDVDVEDVTRAEGGVSRQITITTVPPLPPGRQEAYLYAYADGSPSPISPVRVILIVAE